MVSLLAEHEHVSGASSGVLKPLVLGVVLDAGIVESASEALIR